VGTASNAIHRKGERLEMTLTPLTTANEVRIVCITLPIETNWNAVVRASLEYTKIHGPVSMKQRQNETVDPDTERRMLALRKKYEIYFDTLSEQLRENGYEIVCSLSPYDISTLFS